MKTKNTLWCNKCGNRDVMEIISITPNKTGKYYPYRDTMESETYDYTELTVKCLYCGNERKTEADKYYKMSESDMQKYGYRGSNYGG